MGINRISVPYGACDAKGLRGIAHHLLRAVEDLLNVSTAQYRIQLFFEYFERLGDLQCLACTQLSYRRPLFTFCQELCLKLKNVAIPGTRI